jgi:phosphatidylserine/phosphatidylglycerophosphate/cardiolipin synthase-like enzyme
MRSDAARQHWALPGSRIDEKQGSVSAQLDWLIDNSEAYDSLLQAVREARTSIWISQLAFDADCRAHSSGGAESKKAEAGEGLLDVILATSEEHRVGVRILLNSTLLLDTKRPLTRFLAGCKRDSELIELRGMSRFPQLLHAKMVIIDERRAFLMGSPFVNGYWDDPSHCPMDVRRPARELGGRPVHDVSVALRGPVVQDLAEVFSGLWNGAAKQRRGREETQSIARSEPSPSKARLAGRRTIEVVTTAPGDARDARDSATRGTLEVLLEGIKCARSLIYIEHQYLSSRPVVEALRTALNREKALQIILVLNQNPDVTAYRRWQDARLADSGLLEHPRVGVFALWSARSRDGSGCSINQVFVHSKVVIVDDTWAMVGSANLDGVSLDSYGDDFSGVLARRVFRDVRNFDVSVVLRTRLKSGSAMNPIRELRHRLWTEHLGDASLEALDQLRAGDWTALALRNIALLNDSGDSPRGDLARTFILPYSKRLSPRDQLSDLGVRQLTLMDLRYDPGWLELKFNPNWIRNMFL